MHSLAESQWTRVRTILAVMLLLLGCVAAPAGAEQVKIIAPLQNDTVHNNEGIMRVDVEVIPPLDKQFGKAVRILLDGKPAAPELPANSFTLEGVERGQHWLQAVLVDEQGQALQVSDTIYFTMWQASVNNPALNRRPPR